MVRHGVWPSNNFFFRCMFKHIKMNAVLSTNIFVNFSCSVRHLPKLIITLVRMFARGKTKIVCYILGEFVEFSYKSEQIHRTSACCD